MVKENIIFDKKDDDSSFLTFVAKEFRSRGTELREKLSQKEYASNLVNSLGLKSAEKYHQLNNIAELTEQLLGDRCVLKYARGWSSRGVMLLEKKRENEYFDYMSLRAKSLEDIKAEQNRIANSFNDNAPFWIIEEFIRPTQSTGAIPFDYKFYVFQGQVGLIVQMDRNSSPPKVALLDANFKPLKHGFDYILGSSNVQQATPIVPLHASELMWWAAKLSEQTDSPFVSIDLYDSPEGPVFGEFTFSPGGVHKRLFKFSERQLKKFDILIQDANRRLKKNDDEVKNCYSKLSCKIKEQPYAKITNYSEIPTSLYRELTGVAYNGGSRGALRMIECLQSEKNIKLDKLEVQFLDCLILAWKNVRESIKKESQRHMN